MADEEVADEGEGGFGEEGALRASSIRRRREDFGEFEGGALRSEGGREVGGGGGGGSGEEATRGGGGVEAVVLQRKWGSERRCGGRGGKRARTGGGTMWISVSLMTWM